MKRFVHLAGAALVLLLVLGPAHRATAQLRGVRYCEVLAVFVRSGGLLADVWNTVGFNLCPQADWEALDPLAIRQQLGALFVLLNGPRFWLVDLIEGNPPTLEVQTFGTLTMRRVATVEIPASGPAPPYTPISVDRDTVFRFETGREIYELVDPDGQVYVMQSFAQIVDDRLDEAALPSLGERLALPNLWHYRVRNLRALLEVEDQAGVATVVQDELRNTYQLVVPTPIEIDIRPGSPRNRVEPLARGVVAVALLGSASFDVSEVDPATLAFGPAAAALAHRNGPHPVDLDRDGFVDLLTHFRSNEAGLAEGDADACVSGELLDGTAFEGCDSIATTPRPM